MDRDLTSKQNEDLERLMKKLDVEKFAEMKRRAMRAGLNVLLAENGMNPTEA